MWYTMRPRLVAADWGGLLGFSGPHRQTLYMIALNSLYRVELLSGGPSERAK